MIIVTARTLLPKARARRCLLLASVGAALAWPALAQTPEVPLPVAPVTKDMIEQTRTGNDILVTARRRSETLQDVPISLTSLTGDSLQDRGAEDITNLQRVTPNLTLQVARGSNSTLIAFIRGVGQQDPLWGFEPGVGLYVDDVYIARPQGAVLDIFDIERVEVLRGPQGTLYGRNTIGGAIKYVTRKLSDTPTLRMKGSYGTYNQQDLVVSASTPITDTLRVGAAVARYSRDGFGENLVTGEDQYDKDVFAARVSAEMDATDQLSFRFAADITRDYSNAKHGHREVAGVGEPVLDDVYDTRAGVGHSNFVENRGLSFTAEYRASDIITLKAISSYREGETDTVIDFDNAPSALLDVPAAYADHQFTQELQAVLEFERLKGIVGLYYLDGTAAGAFDTVAGAFNLTTYTAGEVKTRSYAAFADFEYDITDQLAVSVGARYTRDKKEGSVLRERYVGLISPYFGNSAATFFDLRTDYTNDKTFSQFTPRLSVSFKPSDSDTFYASYSKGFKSGGFDMRGDAVSTPDTVDGYDPETVDALEAGYKGSFLDDRVTVAFAGFYSEYKGQQVTTQVPSGATIASFVDNAGRSRIYGAELEGTAELIDQLTASFAVGYTKARFLEFIAYDLGTASYIDVADARVFQNTPEWNGNLALTYTQPFPTGTLQIRPSVSFRSSSSMFETPSVLDQGAYQLVDLSLTWTSESDRWKLGLHGLNLTGEQYRVGGYNFPGAAFNNAVAGFYGPPRTVTATVEFRY